MSHFKKFFFCFLFCFLLVSKQSIYASTSCPYVVLSVYDEITDIGDEFYIVALTSTGKKPTWKSSNSKIASVNTYGKVTAKKAGTVSITAKIKDAEATCKIKVRKTEIVLNKKSISLEHNETFKLSAETSNHSEVTWKSSKKSIAAVHSDGTVTGIKPGETTITAKADGSSVSCKIKVRKPSVRISQTSITLYRKQRKRLTASVSSNITPVWKSNKKSVATVNETGVITAIKHGTATITATVDGVSKTCTVTVKPPAIKLSKEALSIKTGNTITLEAEVSSGISPIWSSSNTSIATVSTHGTIQGLAKGKAYIYATEDGVKKRCTVTVTD